MDMKKSFHLYWIFLGLFIIFPNVSGADPLDHWYWRNPLPQGNTLEAITYGNGTFVAVGDHGTIITSPNAEQWTVRNSGTIKALLGVTYGNGTFVAVGELGTVLTSSNGINWTVRNSGVLNDLDRVTYGNGIFVAVGILGAVLTSPNGIDWTTRNSGTNSHLRSLIYNEGIFVAVGNDGTILTSPNGEEWTVRDSDITQTLQGITYWNGSFWAVGSFSGVLTSTDGMNWRTVETSNALILEDVVSGNDTIVAVGSGSTILISSDGTNWVDRSSEASHALFGVTYANGVFVAVGYRGTILTSSDGIEWTEKNSGTINGLNDVIYVNGTFVAVGLLDTILTSSDGVGWVSRNPGSPSPLSPNYFLGIAYGGNIFVAVGESGVIQTSPDGIDWTKRVSGTTRGLRGITYANGLFVAVGELGTVLTSSGGIDWRSEGSGTTNRLNAVTYGNGTFVAVGEVGTVITFSDDGKWDLRNSGVTGKLTGIAYGNGTFVAVGWNKILTSPDGVDWTDRTTLSLMVDQYSGVTFNNGLFVAVSEEGAILTSPNGINWTVRTSEMTNFLITYYLKRATYGNGTFVAVGWFGTILQSDPLGSEPGPRISVNPASVNFGDVEVGKTQDQSITITNEGDGNLILSAISSPSMPFSKVTDHCSAQTLKPAKSCIVTYRFTPPSADHYSSNSNIPSNDLARNPVTLALDGKGAPGTPVTINLLSPANELLFTSCSYFNIPSFQWDTNGIFKSLEVQFASSQNDFSLPPLIKVKAKIGVSELLTKSSIWKKILLLPGGTGETVYWKVVGTKADKSKAESNVFSLIVKGPKAVGNPQLSHKSKTTAPPPTLSWENNCNITFKVWFGNDAAFTKKKSFSFKVTNPNDNEGVFSKELTSGQWTSIRKLVGDLTDSPIYWYVESWDVLKKYNKTDMQSFRLEP